MSQTVIIVGAPRSGTNMLRDVLTSVPGLGSWACDEINPMWKHGNLDIEHDEIPAERATPAVRNYLRRQFDKRRRADRLDLLVEKTCATSLRVPFVAEVFPDAQYVVIRRDGIDATASTMQRWNASFDLEYTLRKLRYVPPSDVPRHFAHFAGRRLTQRTRGEAGQADNRHVSTWWGPIPHDYRELQAVHPLEELAFIQWQRCVEQSADALAALPESQVHEVVYEDFVADPREGTRALLAFLGRERLLEATRVAQVSTSSVGKGRAHLGADAVSRLEAIGGATLARFGYA